MFVGPTGADLGVTSERRARSGPAQQCRRPPGAERCTKGAPQRHKWAVWPARRRTGTRRQGPRERRRQGRRGRRRQGQGPRQRRQRQGQGQGRRQGGAKVVVEPHCHEGVFIARGRRTSLSREQHAGHAYGKNVVSTAWRTRTARPPKSSTACGTVRSNRAVVLGGRYCFRGGSKVLYLGGAAGTTVSHVSDLVGPQGCVYAVSLAPAGRDLINTRSIEPMSYNEDAPPVQVPHAGGHGRRCVCGRGPAGPGESSARPGSASSGGRRLRRLEGVVHRFYRYPGRCSGEVSLRRTSSSPSVTLSWPSATTRSSKPYRPPK